MIKIKVWNAPNTTSFLGNCSLALLSTLAPASFYLVHPWTRTTYIRVGVLALITDIPVGNATASLLALITDIPVGNSAAIAKAPKVSSCR